MAMQIKSRLFDGVEEILQEADELVREDRDPSANRAIVSAFYNGQETRSVAEAEEEGVAEITNHLFGFDSLYQASQQIFSIYTAAPEIWEVDVHAGPELLRRKWKFDLSRGFNKYVKKARGFKEVWRAAAGEMTLHGRAILCYRNTWDLFPVLANLLVPRGTGTKAEDVTYAISPDRLSLADLRRFLARAETDSRWNKAALMDAIETIEGQVGKGSSGQAGEISSSRKTAEEVEFERQEGGGSGSWRTHLPVYYHYEVDHDDPNLPVSCSIIARYESSGSKNSQDKNRKKDKALYHMPRHFQNVRHWLHPFFVDCIIGQTTTWHRTMGLGKLNYEPDVELEEFFNEAMTGAKENLRRLYRVGDSADRETLLRFMTEHTNLLPEGVDLVEASKNPNYQHAFSIIDRLQLLSSKNSGGGFANNSQGKDELEIQALERQNRNASSLGNRMQDIYESADVLGEEVFRRFCYAVVRPTDRDYHYVQEFREEMERKQIPFRDLARINRRSYRFVSIKTSRAAGDGNDVKERMSLQAMMGVLHLYGPQEQRKILRRFTALNTGDHATAEELVPIQEEPDGNQINRANNENDTCRLRGIAGYIPPRNKDDLDLIHLPEHVGGMEAMLGIGKARGWQDDDAAAFLAMGSHAMQHVQAIQAIPAQKDIGNQFAQQIEGLARAGQEYVNNLQQQKEQQSIDPEKQARLQLEAAKLQQKQVEHGDLVEHRNRMALLSEHKAASQELQGFESLSQREEQLDDQREAMREQARDRALNRAASREK